MMRRMLIGGLAAVGLLAAGFGFASVPASTSSPDTGSTPPRPQVQASCPLATCTQVCGPNGGLKVCDPESPDCCICCAP